MSHADNGPPTIPPSGPATTTRAMARAMRAGPYQHERLINHAGGNRLEDAEEKSIA